MSSFVVVRAPEAVLDDGAGRPLALAPFQAGPAANWRIVRGWTAAISRPASLLRVVVHSCGVFVVATVLALLAVAYVPVLLGRSPALVASGSMQPLLQAGDVVVLDPPRPVIGLDKVVAFEVGDRSMIHRVVGVSDAGYQTKGDANAVADSAIVPPEDVIGVGVMAVPYVGSPHLLYAQGRWFELAAVFAGLIVAFTVSTNRWLQLGRRDRD